MCLHKHEEHSQSDADYENEGVATVRKQLVLYSETFQAEPFWSW